MSNLLRARIFVAMGLPLACVACGKDKVAEQVVPTASVTEPVTSASTPVVPVVPVGIGHPTGMGGCGSEIVCKDDAGPKCAATIPEDMDGLGVRAGAFDQERTDERRKTKKNACCYKAPRAHCGGGRPLRALDDTAIVARAISRADWIDPALEAAAHDDARAAFWLREAGFEHASVASFARTSLQLLALGAPSALVAATHAAALDEIAHARTCFALAARRGAGERGPDRLAVADAPLATTLEAFVRDTFLDGCAAETEAAIEARTRSESESFDAVERAALARIAADEERHAELAWRSLAWAVRTGGEAARDALLAALDARAVSELVSSCARALIRQPTQTTTIAL